MNEAEREKIRNLIIPTRLGRYKVISGGQLFLSYSHAQMEEAQIIYDTIHHIFLKPRKIDAIIETSFAALDPFDWFGRLKHIMVYSVWMDTKLKVGEDWLENITRQISSSVGVIALIPPTESMQIAQEIGVARGKNKRILPITKDIKLLDRYNLSAQQALLGPDDTEDWRLSLIWSVYNYLTPIPGLGPIINPLEDFQMEENGVMYFLSNRRRDSR